jgi:hypothetical protein
MMANKDRMVDKKHEHRKIFRLSNTSPTKEYEGYAVPASLVEHVVLIL